MFAAAALQTARRPAGGNLECAGETMRNGQMDAALMVVAAFALVSVLAAPARAVDDARGRGPAFVDAFREAYDGKDLGAALNLFCWRGINAAKRRAIVGLVERDLAGTLVGTRMLDADARPTTFIIDGVPSRPNAPVVGHLLAEFEEPGGGHHVSIHILGERDRGRCIALAVPDVEI